MSTVSAPGQLPAGLLALALGGFGIGLTEFVILGLLPEVAATYDVSEVAAGWLVSGYALSVVVGALAVTAVATSFRRKHVLLALLVLFIVGNLVSALAPTYTVMLVGRIVAALCHGAFFGIGSVVAASLVAPERKAGAIAIMFAGLTTANVLGVPFGTFVGQQLGWRATFDAIAVIGVVALIGIAVLVDRDAGASAGVPHLGTELRAFRSMQVWFSIAATVLGFGGLFGAFAYIAYTLTEVSGFASSTVPWLLVLFGLGLFGGNLAGGRAADRGVDRSLLRLFAALTVVLVAFALLASSKSATMVLLLVMGAVGFATVPGLQMRVMSYAPQAPTMASSANIGAFNLGNAIGTWLGGLAIAAGLGFTAPIWIGAAMSLAAVAVIVVARRHDRSRGMVDEARVAAPV